MLNSLTESSEARATPVNHMVQLDGLRGVAILCVMIWHFVNHDSPLVQAVQWGWVGVRLFFVLSGFLITGILLRARQQLQSTNQSAGRTLRNFYYRRFLRIFPVYYVFIFALFVMHPVMRQNIAWFVTYLQNMMFAIDGEFSVGAHLWTLAVEEQFYLVWPCLMLFLPQRWLLPACVLAILLGPLSRLACLLAGWSSFSAMLLTSSNMDTLAMGSILAMLVFSANATTVNRFTWTCLVFGLPILAAYVVCHNLGMDRVSQGQQTAAEWLLFVSADFGAALTYAFVVYRASVGFGGLVGRVLSLSPLTYLGTISYGVYLFHDHVKAALLEIVFPAIHWKMPESDVLSFAIFGAASIAVAAASWHFFEKPLNDFKRYFPYVEKTAGASDIRSKSAIRSPDGAVRETS